ncbi:TPA: type II secretion system protein GspM [Escherichia coli]
MNKKFKYKKSLLAAILSATLLAERGENIQVWIDPVVFNDLLNWLNALDEKYALRVTQIDVSAAEKPGMVNVQRLEFGRG